MVGQKYIQPKHLKTLTHAMKSHRRYIITAKDTNGDLWFLWIRATESPNSRVSVSPAMLSDDQDIAELIKRFSMTETTMQRCSLMVKIQDALWHDALEDYEHEEDRVTLKKSSVQYLEVLQRLADYEL